MSENGTKERLYNFVKKFSFPRLAGTFGEKEAVDLTFDTFKSIGYDKEEIIRQSFNFSTFYSEVFIKIIIIMNIISIAILLLIKYILPFFTIIFIGIILLIFISMNKVFKHPELKGFWENNFGKTFSATNVFTKVCASALPTKIAGDIIVSAHLDSKSQTYVTFWRVKFFKIWLYGEISLVFFYLIYLIDYHQLVTVFWPLIYFIEFGIIITTGLVITSNIFLLFLKIENKSPGALDNATGMAIVFELSSLFRVNPLKNFNIWFCQFSAEEIGTMGSRNFIDTYTKNFNKKKKFLINFDMISAKNEKNNCLEFIESYGMFPRKKISPLLSNFIEKAVNKMNLTIKKIHVSIGAHTDSIPFHLKDFDTVDFITKSAAKYAHSKKDTPDKVDYQILYETCKIIHRFILMLDKNY
ncbi:MAG: M28 family metallopeptidase [Promethearchaeota archaeon]